MSKILVDESALKQALAALENLRHSWADARLIAITALRGALAQQAEPAAWQKEYDAINKFYAEKTAVRSKLPLIRHIDDGLHILSLIGATDRAKAAFCLHPIVQNNEDVDVSWSPAYTLACEYRDRANAYLCCPETDWVLTVKDVRSIVGEMSDECRTMLIADKRQNYADFIVAHFGNHKRSSNLDRYFRLWLAFLECTAPPAAQQAEPVDVLHRWAAHNEDVPTNNWQRGYEAARVWVRNVGLPAMAQRAEPVGEVVCRTDGDIERGPEAIVALSSFVSLGAKLYTDPTASQQSDYCRYPDCKCPTDNPCLKGMKQQEEKQPQSLPDNCKISLRMRCEECMHVQVVKGSRLDGCNYFGSAYHWCENCDFGKPLPIGDVKVDE